MKNGNKYIVRNVVIDIAHKTRSLPSGNKCELVGALEHDFFKSFHTFGMSFQLTFIVFRGVETTNQ